MTDHIFHQYVQIAQSVFVIDIQDPPTQILKTLNIDIHGFCHLQTLLQDSLPANFIHVLKWIKLYWQLTELLNYP